MVNGNLNYGSSSMSQLASTLLMLCNGILFHSGVQSSLYVRLYICLSVFPSISLYICLYLCLFFRVAFCKSKHTARNCVQHIRPQAPWSNTLNGSILCPSVRSSTVLLQIFYSIVLILDMITIAITITSVGFHNNNAFIPQTGVRRTPVWSS